jgi:glutamate 5-kinase
MADFAADLARMRARGQQVLVVSSGAVALGRRRLGLGKRISLAEKQAAAAAGQSALMRAWETALEPHGLACAQILLTRDDTEMRRRWLNARATLDALLALGVIPVINENDTVVTEEIRVGDNDRLSARVAQLVGAEALVLLSDIEGLYTADPRRDPTAAHIPRVTHLTPEIEAMAGGANTTAGVGTGGMATKLAAARIAAAAGCATFITLGTRPGPLAAVEEGARATVIEPDTTPAAAYKAWIAGSLSPTGALIVDAGAAAAVRRGKSLLAAGVTAIEGRFDKGDAVLVRDEAGLEIARGLIRYVDEHARRIVGLKSAAIEPALGYTSGPMIHADDLALAASPQSA